jgi:GT2 family glycosyltransferase
MPKGKLPPFYVITVNYHNAVYIKELIASLEGLGFIGKIIVVNHSPDENLELLKGSFIIQVISQKNMGYGAGLNRGLQEVTEENAIVLLCNPDISLVTPTEVEGALKYMVANPRIGCLIPLSVDNDYRSLSPCRTFFSWKSILASRVPIFWRIFPWLYREHFYVDYKGDSPFEVDWGCGAVMLYRVSAFGKRPPFDEDFFLYMEDIDLCARLWQTGKSVVHYPKLIFRHRAQRQSLKSLRFLLYHIDSLLKYIRKYKGLPDMSILQKSSQCFPIDSNSSAN